MLKTITTKYQQVIASSQVADGIAPLLMRLYLAPVMLQAGWNKVTAFPDIVAWFGNTEWGLGLPFPTLMAGLATQFLMQVNLVNDLINQGKKLNN